MDTLARLADHLNPFIAFYLSPGQTSPVKRKNRRTHLGNVQTQGRPITGLSVWVAFCCAVALWMGVLPIHLRAQSSANIPTPVVFAGVTQARDGNYYSTLANGGPYCSVNYKYICGAVYQTTPQGVVTEGFDFGPAQGSNGSYPNALIEGPDGSLYGTTNDGGPNGSYSGVFFKVALDGTFTLIHAFTSAELGGTDSYHIGGGSLGHLVLGSDGNFYGYTTGHNGAGVIYKITPDGVVTLLHDFNLNAQTGGGFIPSGLIEASDGNFYGTLQGYGGATGLYASSGGFLFKMTPSGVLTNVAEFPDNGSLGYDPNGDLAQGPDGSIYGVTRGGSNSGQSNALPTIYKYTPGGVIQTLYTFPSSGVNGYDLESGLILGSDGNLYGTSVSGANATCYRGCGTVFEITPTGTFTLLHSFAGGTDGGSPYGPIIQSSDGTITGTNGGTTTATPGTIYSFSEGATPPINLSFQLGGQNVTTVGSSQPITLNWNVLNAFSTTAQQCYASQLNRPAGNTDWTGKQTGSVVNGAFTGSATFDAPTAVGTYTYSLTCAGLETGLATLSVAGVTVTTATLPDGTVSQPYNAVVQALGGITPYKWGYSGSFPPGLTLDAVSGFITGSPTQFGTYQFTVGATDSSNTPQSGTKAFSVKIASGLSLISSLKNGAVGTAYNQTATETGGLGPFKWALTSGKLPDGLTLNTSSGVLSGTPTVVGKYIFSITVTDGEGTPATYTQSYTVSTAIPVLSIVSGNWPDCTVKVLCEGQYEATGGTPPYTWSITPGAVFPPGLTLSSAGVFTGLPLQYTKTPGLVTFGNDVLHVQVTDSETPAVTVSDASTLDIVSGLSITSIPLPIAVQGVAYQSPPPVATGGVPPYTWQISSPLAPQLITEYARDMATGVLFSSAPVSLGTFALTYTVTDSEIFPAASASMSASLTVVPAQVTSVTTLTSSGSSVGAGMSVTLTAQVTSAGGVVPSGAVTFYNGATALGTATLNANATATLPTSFSAAGVYTLSARYGGAGSIAASVSSPLTQTVVTPTVSASFAPASLTITAGGSGTLALTLTPVAGYTGTVAFSCGTLPAHVSCTFAPSSLTIVSGSGPVTDTLTIRTSDATMSVMQLPAGRGNTILVTACALPAYLALCLIGLRRRRFKLPPLALVLVLFASLSLLSGCGAGSTVAKPGTYTIPITLQVSGAGAQIINATLVVN
jgi:uncharacterized repeat protein (TIGR03803 family)